MAITTIVPTRVILHNGRKLADINPDLPVTQIVQMHAATEPALANATVEGPVLSKDGKTATYEAKLHVGVKG